MTNMNYIAKVVSGLVVSALLFTSGIGCRNQTAGSAQSGWRLDLPKGVSVDLPRDTSNAQLDKSAAAKDAIIISIPGADQIYPGKERVPRDQLGARIDQLISEQSEPNKVAYIASGAGVAYGNVLEVIEILRRRSILSIGLLTVAKNQGNDGPYRFLLTIPAKDSVPIGYMKVGQKIIGDPMTLLVSVSSDLKLELNLQPQGKLNDQTLGAKLTEIFQQRSQNHAYKPGYETRNDLPESERLEKTVFIKAPRSILYGDVIKLIDIVSGTGASPVGLHPDDVAN